MRCPHVDHKGRRCLARAGGHQIHTYARPKPFGRKTISERGEVDLFRERVQARSGGYCEVPAGAWFDVCGLSFRHAGEHAHHIKLRSQGGTHEASNGLFCCFDAHRWIHDHPGEAQYRGLLKMKKARADAYQEGGTPNG